MFTDEYFMKQAFREAEIALEAGEVPIGAVIVSGDRIIGRGHNQTEQFADVTAHAEILALSAATQHLGAKYLPDCTLYVTLEPCPMCAAALAWAQIGKIVFGASDAKRGYQRFTPSLLHPKTQVVSGIMAAEAEALIKDFFAGKRG